MKKAHMVNRDFEPSDACEDVLQTFKDGRESDAPWGRATPRYIIDETGLEKSDVEYHLRRLRDAGWIQRVTRGLYEYVDDPRD